MREQVFTRFVALVLVAGAHELEIETQGDGEVAIESFYVFQPPEK
jgi:hypothetical protein